MKNTTISLTAIVKNEESNIDRMLASLKDDVDEMVIVDTGSTDKTIEIAKSYGAIVLERPWDNDFSAARNYAFENATSEWALIMDADEELDVSSRGRIKLNMKANTDITAYYMSVENVGIGTHFSSLRLFKNDGTIRYTKKVHETLGSTSKDHPMIVYSSELKILHYGYDRDPKEMEKKNIRNESILYAQLQDDPNDLGSKYYLATMKAENNRDIEGALDICNEILRGPKDDISVYVHAALLSAQLLLSTEQYANTINEIKKRPELMNYTPMLAFYYGMASMRLENYSEAINAFNFCLNFDTNSLHYGLIATNLKSLSREHLLTALLRSKQLGQAKKMAHEILGVDPGNKFATEMIKLIGQKTT